MAGAATEALFAVCGGGDTESLLFTMSLTMFANLSAFSAAKLVASTELAGLGAGAVAAAVASTDGVFCPNGADGVDTGELAGA